MKRNSRSSIAAFTVAEMMVVVAMTTVLLGATITASISLQKSLAAADKFFGTHIQQIRIIDYLSRDVKRATAVSTSTDRTTVTCTVPKYIVEAGDSEVAAGTASEGARRTPVITVTISGPRVDYGRRVSDAVTTTSSSTLTSATAKFTAADVGSQIWGTGIPEGATITARNSATSVTLSKTAKLTGTSVTVTWARNDAVVYALNNQTIERRENGAVTTIAASTDQLVPDTVDVEQANTEYAASTVT
ncbi:MAG TPA: hypothetical protein VF551_04385, partial [Chthoniobacterales bacterium]